MAEQQAVDPSNPQGYGADLPIDVDVERLVLYEKVEKHIAVITLNRPERLNALLMPDSFEQLDRRLIQAQDDDEVKVIVLTGTGRAFCAGADMRRTPVESFGLRKGQRLPQSRRIRGISRVNKSEVLNCDKTTIAVVNGPAMAAGFQLVLCSDIVVASENATFAEPETRIGFAGMVPYLPVFLLKLGINRARVATLTGRTMSAQELQEWGFIASVVPEDRLMDEGLRFARAVAWHSTDNLMLGRKAMQLFWRLAGTPEYATFFDIAHPLFTNVVYRDDEFNFLRQRNKEGMQGAFQEMARTWAEFGFA